MSSTTDGDPTAIVDLFAGPGGWSQALLRLGLREVGLELDHAACRTRAAAGHATIRADVTAYPTWPFRGRARKVIASPVCPSFGKSGKGLGLIDMPLVHQCIDDLANGIDSRAKLKAGCLDERSILTAEPMRWFYDLHPETICMEQVPSVLPLWEHYAAVLRTWGYSVATGIVNAAGLGVAQRRPRAILAASRLTTVLLPLPTHGGPGQPAELSMFSAVGWGYTRRPAPTVTGGGTYTGGPEPFGNGTRQAMRKAMLRDGEWAPRGVDHLRPTIAESAVLQGFPADYPFFGGAGQRAQQVGNAIAVPVAAAVLSAALGIPLRLDRPPVLSAVL